MTSREKFIGFVSFEHLVKAKSFILNLTISITFPLFAASAYTFSNGLINYFTISVIEKVRLCRIAYFDTHVFVNVK